MHGSGPRARAELFVPPVLFEDALGSEDDDDDACGVVRASTPSLTRAIADLDAFLVHPSTPAPGPSSTLSLKATPFHPVGNTTGQTRAYRWADEDLIDASDVDSMPTSMAFFLDAVRQGP